MENVAMGIWEACDHLDGRRELGECSVNGTGIGSGDGESARVRMFLARKPEIHPRIRELAFTVSNVTDIHERTGESGLKNLLIEGKNKSIIVNEDGDVDVK